MTRHAEFSLTVGSSLLLSGILTLFVVLVFPLLSFAQSVSSRTPAISIPRVHRGPVLEDFLGMKPGPDFEGRMAKVEDFTQQTPSDGQPSSQRTEVYLGYDDANLYVVFVAFDSEPHRVRARLSRRENISDEDDWVEVALDTFSDQRRGFLFDCSPLGVQWDALWSEAGGEDPSFDTVWASRGQLTAEGYVVWMAIPFKSLRFPPEGLQTWGIIFTRWIPRVPEKSTWPHVSSGIQGRLNQAGRMSGLEQISPGRNLQFIPYGVFRAFRALDDLDPNAPRFTGKRADIDGGLDAKIVMKDSLVLDVALNPDFSQVESDEPQVTVNQRFEVFFPEKRPFFIENSSFFQTPINLLFTRRIADPQLGVRLTGKLGPYSLGALFADDQAPGKSVLPGDPLRDRRAWFGVLRMNRDVFGQSTLGLIYTHRQFDDSSNRVFGVDGRFKLGRNWVTRFQAVGSNTRNLDGSQMDGTAYDFLVSRSGRKFGYEFEFNDRSPGFRTHTGFLRRADVRQFRQRIRYEWRPEGKFLISWGPVITTRAVYDHSGTRLDFLQDNALSWEFGGQSELVLFYTPGRERLRRQDFPGLPSARDFSRESRGMVFETNHFQWVSLSGGVIWAKVINIEPPEGQEPFLAASRAGQLQLTLRPVTRLRVDNSLLTERLIEPNGRSTIYNIHIVRSKWNYQFTRELSARVILQYETLLPSPALTDLQKEKNFNADFLLTYLVNPWTALYVGYNSNLQNIDVVPTAVGSEIVRRDDFINDARGLFIKFSYLLRF